MQQPVGKQCKFQHSAGCHYTRTTGIWQSVWMEPVDAARLVSYKTYSDIAHCTETLQMTLTRPAIGRTLTVRALFDSRELEITEMEEGVLDNASYYGRIFARCGGLADAVAQGLKERGVTDFDLKAVSCDGIEECRMALLKKSKKVLDANFIEGMACVGGCIGGAGCLTHGERNKAEVDKYGKEALEKTISDALSQLGNID